MKIASLAVAAALALAGSAFAATHEGDTGSSSAGASAHQFASSFNEALHKLGNATRHALQRADASLHRLGRHDTDKDRARTG